MVVDPVQTHVAKELKHETPLVACRVDPTGRFIFAGAQDNSVIRWDLTNDAKLLLPGHESWVRSFGFTPNGETVITGGWDGRLIWWPAAAEAPQPQRTVEAHDGWIRAVAVSPDGKLLASCGNDLKLKLWNIADGTLVRETLGHERHIYNVAFHPDGQHVVTGDLAGKFVQWNTATGEKVREFAVESISKYDAGFQAHYGGPHCMTFTSDGQRLITGGITNVTNAFAAVGNPIIVEVQWTDATVATTHLTKANINGKAWGLVWHPQGFIVGALGGAAGGRLTFWKTGEKDEFHELNLGANIRDLTLHPDGVQLVSAHFDGVCRLSRMTAKA